MPNYECPRCDFVTHSSTNMKNNISRKNQCQLKNDRENIKLDIEKIESYKTTDNLYIQHAS